MITILTIKITIGKKLIISKILKRFSRLRIITKTRIIIRVKIWYLTAGMINKFKCILLLGLRVQTRHSTI